MRITTGLLAVMTVANACQTAEASHLLVGMLYADARKSLFESGWQPTDYTMVDGGGKDLDDYLRVDFLKRGIPEVGSCFPTGESQCFAVWQRRNDLMVIESRSEGYNPVTGPTVYFFYEVRMHHPVSEKAPPTRQEWDPRSADIVPGSFPADRPW